jgi:HEAT repeat protein
MSDTNETSPVWRQALNDSNHPLYSAAWTIFSPDMNLDAADKRLADHKERVIPFLIDILDTPQLSEETALGGGHAPINAVSLLGRWKVVEAVPRLLAIVEEQDFEDLIWDRATTALEAMGPEAIDPVLQAAAQTTDTELRTTFASVLSQAGKGDPRAFEYIKAEFAQQKDELDIEVLAEDLLMCNAEAGSALLEEQLKQAKFSKKLRKKLRRTIDDARKGDF